MVDRDAAALALLHSTRTRARESERQMHSETDNDKETDRYHTSIKEYAIRENTQIRENTESIPTAPPRSLEPCHLAESPPTGCSVWAFCGM
jgi:hypothetical protein